MRIYLVNLIVMNIAWSAAFFSYYMLGFYVKYIPGDVFTNVVLSSVAEGSACCLAGLIANMIGTKITLLCAFMTAGTFGMALIFIPAESTTLITVCLIIAKLGASSSLNQCFLVTSEFFPVAHSSTAFSACNMLARVTTILSAMIAELPQPYPMMIFAFLCFLSTLGMVLLDKNDTEMTEEELIAKKLIQHTKQQKELEKRLID